VTALNLKLARDLWRLRGQALAIALVLAAATATFIMSMGLHRSLTQTRDAYYARNQFADLFSGMVRAPRAVVARIAAVPGVARAEGGIQSYATLDMPGTAAPVRALFNALDDRGQNRLNQVTLRLGRMPQPGQQGEVVADEAFAKANGLAPGSRITALIHGRRLSLLVVGIGMAPNFVYAMAPGDLLPDEKRFGVFWMGRRGLEAATDRQEAINSLSVTLERGANAADVIRAIDAVLAPYGGTGAYGREDHLSHAFIDNELQQLDAITQVIPPVFLVVAVFLVTIVMGRMIRTERGQIGLLKAFGYSDWAVAAHYLKFAAVIALLATLMGAAAGIWMGREMARLYSEYYHFPFLDYIVSPPLILAAGALSLVTAGLGAAFGVRSAVQLSPAVAMSPPPPPIYRAGAVEQLGRRLGFSAIGHMIVRHIARWPGRSAITVLGVAMAGGLLFSTLQFIDSSRTMIDSYFFRAQRQDLTVTFVEPRGADVLFALAQLPGVLRVEPARGLAVRLVNGTRVERTAIEATRTDTALSLRIDSQGRAIDLPEHGLLLSRQLADKLGVRAGQRIEVQLLGGRRTVSSLPVVSIVDEYIGKRAYAAETTLAALARDNAPVGAALLRIDPAQRGAILARLKAMPQVLGVNEKAASLRQFEKMIDDNILTMIIFYVGFASAIVVGVVYNSARIIHSERAHELATLRVLGYYRGEVALVLLGELALLVVLATPFACLIGYGLAQLMTAMFSSDLFRLPFAPDRSSYGWSIIIVLLAAAATAGTVALRVQRLDMVRVLKARE
jgi:putative ABC transport system permease protein